MPGAQKGTQGKETEGLQREERRESRCSVLCVRKVRRVCTCASRSGSGKWAGLETGGRPAFGEFIAVTEEGGDPSAAFSPLQEK